MATASTETLFRFVTFRKPEQGTKTETEAGFIYHPTKGWMVVFLESKYHPLK